MLPSKNHVLSWNYPKALSRYLITNVTQRAIISVKSHIFLYSFYFLRVLNNNRLEWDYDTFLIIRKAIELAYSRLDKIRFFYWRSEFFSLCACSNKKWWCSINTQRRRWEKCLNFSLLRHPFNSLHFSSFRVK